MRKDAGARKPEDPPVKTLEDLRHEVEKITDGLGKPVDKGIKETVVALWSAGFPTSGSCEGHKKWGLPYPWVDIEVPEPDDGDEDEAIQAEWRRKNEPYITKMQFLLHEFYENRKTDHDVRLGLVAMGLFGGFRLQISDIRSEETIRALDKLKECQQEMKDFAKFLLQRQSKNS